MSGATGCSEDSVLCCLRPRGGRPVILRQSELCSEVLLGVKSLIILFLFNICSS
jgi:hypothetical protein